MSVEHPTPSDKQNLPPEGERVLRLPEVKAILAVGTSFVYSELAKGRFPKPISLGSARGWLHSEIMAYLAARVAERDGLPSNWIRIGDTKVVKEILGRSDERGGGA
jgi:prophage regulatory protein